MPVPVSSRPCQPGDRRPGAPYVIEAWLGEGGMAQLGSQTQLRLGPGNVFPLAATTCPPAQVSSCNTGADIGHDTLNQFALVCTGG